MTDLSARTHPIAPGLPNDLWIARALTLSTGIGLQVLGLYAAVVTFGAWNTVGLYAIGGLAVVLHHVVLGRATCSFGE